MALELTSVEGLTRAATLIVPGIVIVAIRTRAIAGTAPNFKEQLATFAIVSAAYLSVAGWAFNRPWGLYLPAWFWTLSLNLLVPTLIGLALCYAHQKRVIYWLAERIRLKLFHHLPSAWDYTFDNFEPGSFVLVQLKDGKQIAGKLGTKSFISSTKEERDILIESVWDITSGTWTEAQPPRSILLCGGDIRWIEIF